ncbi:SCP2 sterol-binding domain-containing protein [Entomomonas sp. E2T0]|uniref:SCP2 sterol-binding domain-containing protein n=1 Tax=Entomomonas sp. E2T0 TaxID=2930213 RepID=UPI0022283F88|nr:SCP2 sterol-binding domain-containing protein [Entomomonas sp. E2T0]UYZ83821.1 SCP2 sterol-binding domain-containing protein [Entomomonas sp. E2T0]
MSADEIIEQLKSKFNPEAAQGKDLTFQFMIEGYQNYSLKVKDGTCDIVEGIVDNADVTLSMDKQDFKAMLNKELNAMMALMTGKLKIDGNPLLAMQLSQLFSI